MTCFEVSRRYGRPCELHAEHGHYPEWLRIAGDPRVFLMLSGWWPRRRER